MSIFEKGLKQVVALLFLLIIIAIYRYFFPRKSGSNVVSSQTQEVRQGAEKRSGSGYLWATLIVILAGIIFIIYVG
ncbi:MAG: hypothetical protein LUC93_08300 [Planctomycetaceae bacterium]|nr:hypothetical protein [Planctomycetaceae bacterium]